MRKTNKKKKRIVCRPKFVVVHLSSPSLGTYLGSEWILSTHVPPHSWSFRIPFPSTSAQGMRINLRRPASSLFRFVFVPVSQMFLPTVLGISKSSIVCSLACSIACSLVCFVFCFIRALVCLAPRNGYRHCVGPNKKQAILQMADIRICVLCLFARLFACFFICFFVFVLFPS